MAERYRNLTDKEWELVVALFPNDNVDDAYLDLESARLVLSDHTTGRHWQAPAPTSFFLKENR